MIDSDLSCKHETRREAVRSAALFGLDYLEVSANQLTLTVFFLGKAPPNIDKHNVIISGGSRIKGIKPTGVTVYRQIDPAADDSMDVRVSHAGDFSTYTLRLVHLDKNGNATSMPGFDSRYSELDFTFKGSCPTGLDCLPQRACPPPARSQPEINYLAKDYDSFRQLILDRLSLVMPAWRESHAPDIGVALVELLAYVGDYLSYYQDAVATEAYLGTARQRISVRRHVRLIDYAMHEGCNARAWLTLWTDSDQTFDLSQLYFITAYPGAPASRVLNELALANVPTSKYDIFQPLLPSAGTFSIFKAHREIHFYTWGDESCCLAPGATSATLVDDWAPAPAEKAEKAEKYEEPPNAKSKASAQTERTLQLKPGDVLIFEEILGPHTGNPSDADPTHRQAVRLTKVTPSMDALFDQPVVEIQWSAQDALSFPLCISAQSSAPDCEFLQAVSVARGNVILVDHGVTTREVVGAVPTVSSTVNCPSPCHPSLVQIKPGLFRPTLRQAPLTYSQPLPSGACSAADLIQQDPRLALPGVALSSIPAAPATSAGDSLDLPPLFTFDDLHRPALLAEALKTPGGLVMQYLNSRLSAAVRKELNQWDGTSALPSKLAAGLVKELTGMLQAWHPVSDLLESREGAYSFVAEMDDDGICHLRFGDGRLGRQPEAGALFESVYRTGNGPVGNVGAGTICYLVLRNETLSGVDIQPRNPLPAVGGTEPEPVPEVKLFAPHAFQDVIERAITADDYATLAVDNARRIEQRPARAICTSPFVPLQAAKATLRWTGGWYQALIAIDPVNSEKPSAALLGEIQSYLEPYRRMGHDVVVAPANYIPIDLALSICVLPDFERAKIEDQLHQLFSSAVQEDGTRGVFHPDNMTFGEGIYASRIIAAAQGVKGVASVSLKRLQRYHVNAHPEPVITGIASGAVPAFGVLTFGPFEIARLDNDPSFPENGRLELKMRGGR
jgi:hypothetical protein